MRHTDLAKKNLNENDMLIKQAEYHFAICLDNTDYPASLERHKIYRVLPDQDAAADGDLRVIDESEEDYLYPAAYFLLLPVLPEIDPVLRDSFKTRPAMDGLFVHAR